MILLAVALVAVGVALFTRRHATRATDSWSSRLLLRLASSAAPDEEWPRAMLAEHDAISDPGERRSFARGALVALARTPPRWRGTADVFAVAVGVVAAAVLAVVGLVRYPGLRVGTSWIIYTVLFVFALVAYLLIALVAARFGSSRDHLVGALVGVAGLPLGLLVGAVSSEWSVLATVAVVLLPTLAVLIDASSGGEETRPWVTGLTCTATTGLAFFAGFVTQTLASNGGTATPTLLAEQLRSGIHPYATWAVGDALGGACFMLAFVLVIGGPLAVGVGALIGRRASRHAGPAPSN